MAQSQSASSAGTSLRGTTYVSFVCQRCYQPLRLDHSFKTLDHETLRELTGKQDVRIFARPVLFVFTQVTTRYNINNNQLNSEPRNRVYPRYSVKDWQ